jgi:hypothetical protein
VAPERSDQDRLLVRATLALVLAIVALGLMVLLIPTAQDLGSRDCGDLSVDVTSSYEDLASLLAPVVGIAALILAGRGSTPTAHDRRRRSLTRGIAIVAGVLWTWYAFSAVSLTGC